MPESSMNSDDMAKNTRGAGDADGELPVLERHAKIYEDTGKACRSRTEFCSTSSVDDIFETLVGYVQNKSSDYEVSDKNYKIKFGVESKVEEGKQAYG